MAFHVKCLERFRHECYGCIEQGWITQVVWRRQGLGKYQEGVGSVQGYVRRNVLRTQGTACAKAFWCGIPGHIQETPNNSGWLELGHYHEHPEERWKDFNWGIIMVDMHRRSVKKVIKIQVILNEWETGWIVVLFRVWGSRGRCERRRVFCFMTMY